MKRSELSVEDQNLLGTEFPAELEKEAASEVAIFAEMYDTGFEKIAVQMADTIDQTVAEQPVELNKEAEERAADCGAAIERGVYDGLRKLGAERHNDEMHYLRPLIEEKVAGMKEHMAHAAEKLKGAGKYVAEKAKAGAHHANPMPHLNAAKGMAGKEKAKELAKGVGKAVGLGAAGAGAGFGAYKAFKKKPEHQEE